MNNKCVNILVVDSVVYIRCIPVLWWKGIPHDSQRAHFSAATANIRWRLEGHRFICIITGRSLRRLTNAQFIVGSYTETVGGPGRENAPKVHHFPVRLTICFVWMRVLGGVENSLPLIVVIRNACRY